MARTRQIKPGFFTNEHLGGLPPLTRLFFAGLWGHQDREGRCEDRPLRLKAQILPYDDADAEEMLSQLDNGGFITRYEVDGKKYIQTLTFAKNQSPATSEAASEIPPKVEQCLTDDEHLSEVRHKSVPLVPCTLDLVTSTSTPPKGAVVGPAEFIQAWNEMAASCEIHLIADFTDERKKQLRARSRKPYWRENWRRALDRVRGSPFCNGSGERAWLANPKWFLRPDTVTEILEGKYDDRPATSRNDPGRVRTPGKYANIGKRIGTSQPQEGVPDP